MVNGGNKRSRRTEAMGRLAGGVAHDFNNILTVILGYAVLIEDEGGDAVARTQAREIRKAVERASALTGRLLAFSHQQLTVASATQETTLQIIEAAEPS
jgi:two-component system cell cycle sensor histidine kinase/response regulator CckA